MFGIRRIVAGIEMPSTRPWTVDGLSLPVRLAMEHAVQVAAPSRIPVTLTAVIADPAAGWFSSREDADRNHATDQLAAESVLKQLVSGFTKTPVDCRIQTGAAWEELIRVAGHRPDCLLVCGTRDLQSLRRMLFGSTGLKLLRLAPGPVWIVKPRVEENESIDIVAATDIGPVGEDVLMTAVGFARNLNARLHVVHCIEPTGIRSSPMLSESERIQQAESMVREQLFATDFRTLPFGVKVHIRQQSADQGILEVVSEANADLVILGTSSKKGASGLLPGSTVERLLPELSCSVLALKPEGFRSALPADFWSVDQIS